MTPPETQALHETSRLASCLQALELGDTRQSRHNLVERLAELIDLSDAFTLSEHLRGLPRMKFTPSALPDPQGTVEAIKTHFIHERSAMMATLLQKSTPAADNRLLGLEAPATFDILLRFYTLQQSEIEHQVLKLRLHLREAMMPISREMQQLALLDAALADTVNQETRKALACLPRLLQKRFVRLKNETDGYPQFIHDMQNLLLAELDTRLQPLMGLVEALDDTVRN